MPPPETKNPPLVAASEGSDSSISGRGLNRKDTPAARTLDEFRQQRYRVDSAIKRILRVDAKRLDPTKYPANVHRTIGCTWNRIGTVSLVKAAATDHYHFKGLAICGNVWTCPLCAAKIQERRRQEVALLAVYAATIQRQTVMVSYTFPHRVDQPLHLLLRLQQEAIKRLREGKAYKQLMTLSDYAGRVRALELTHGQNGWHPHTHELLLVGTAAHAYTLQCKLACLWLKACRAVGLFVPARDDEDAFLRHAVDVRAGDEGAAAYIAKMDDQTKWGISHELTKGSSKQGRRSGRHPFHLAMDPATANLFVEYVHGMKGQRQLVWSRDLKKAVGLRDKTDEEIAEEQCSMVEDEILIPNEAWRYVIGNDARWEVTQAAKLDGAAGVARYLRLLGYSDE
jgi:hypothetical protein